MSPSTRASWRWWAAGSPISQFRSRWTNDSETTCIRSPGQMRPGLAQVCLPSRSRSSKIQNKAVIRLLIDHKGAEMKLAYSVRQMMFAVAVAAGVAVAATQMPVRAAAVQAPTLQAALAADAAQMGEKFA